MLGYLDPGCLDGNRSSSIDCEGMRGQSLRGNPLILTLRIGGIQYWYEGIHYLSELLRFLLTTRLWYVIPAPVVSLLGVLSHSLTVHRNILSFSSWLCYWGCYQCLQERSDNVRALFNVMTMCLTMRIPKEGPPSFGNPRQGSLQRATHLLIIRTEETPASERNPPYSPSCFGGWHLRLTGDQTDHVQQKDHLNKDSWNPGQQQTLRILTAMLLQG